MPAKTIALIVRLSDRTLHRAAKIAAAASGQSLNAYIVSAVRGQVLRDAMRDKRGPVAAAIEQAGGGKKSTASRRVPE